MESGNLIEDRSFNFALAILDFYKFLLSEKEFVLSKQLVRSGLPLELMFQKQKRLKVERILYQKFQLPVKKQEKRGIG